jgi:hypothetical protein
MLKEQIAGLLGRIRYNRGGPQAKGCGTDTATGN